MSELECLAKLPVARPSALMSHGNYFYEISGNTIKHAKRKSGEEDAPCSVDRYGPSTRRFKDLSDDAINFK